MPGDATPKQIENRRTVIFWTIVIFLILVIIGIIGAIMRTLTPKVETEADVATELVEQGNAEREAFPIVAHLPIKNSLFTLGYQFSNQGKNLTLKVSTTETYLDVAINKLTSFGYDLTNCALDVTKPDNPFLSAYIVNGEQDPVAALRAAYVKIPSFAVVKTTEASTEADANVAAKTFILAKITTGLSDHYNLQTYRVILTKNSDGNWTPVANPAPLLNLYNTPNVAIELLRQANQL